MSGSKAMLDKVDFFRSLNFKDLEKLVEFNDGLPKELKNPPWRVPTNIPKEKVDPLKILEALIEKPKTKFTIKISKTQVIQCVYMFRVYPPDMKLSLNYFSGIV